ncbi:MAG: transposase [Patescibacteria group bacterium]|nr:transposase [Patescibacteria group bacterium]MCL5432268.1 transposase [Patescibacteria group bacterium]
MAAKNSIKAYIPDGYYHLYNRGVAKNDIYHDEVDYAVFLSYLKAYLLPKDEEKLLAIVASPQASYKEKYQATKLLNLKNFCGEITLLAYALMPNHFHLLIKQKSASTIDNFMNALGTRYAGFFNRKYHRVGPLFQGVYKAVPIQTEEQLLHVSRYIHLNPKGQGNLPTSLPEYLGQRDTAWVNSSDILHHFNKKSQNNSYIDFMKAVPDLTTIPQLLIDL